MQATEKECMEHRLEDFSERELILDRKLLHKTLRKNNRKLSRPFPFAKGNYLILILILLLISCSIKLESQMRKAMNVMSILGNNILSRNKPVKAGLK